jgi:hypothetical protein
MKLTKFYSLLFYFLLFVHLVFLAYFIFPFSLIQGQITKQIFAAEMIRSFSEGQVSGVFPIRHFMDISQAAPLPWAEEFPIYTGLVAWFSSLTSLPLIAVGRGLSLFFFLLLLVGCRKMARIYAGAGAKKSFAYLFPIMILSFPVFRVYSTQVMPDMAMMGCLGLGLGFYMERNYRQSCFWVMLATCFKYFAVFTGIGLFLHYVFVASKSQAKLGLKNYFLMALVGFSTLLPVLLYLGWFLSHGIPNPIVGGGIPAISGHFSNGGLLFSGRWLARLFTWYFIKNATPVGGVLALVFLGTVLSRYLRGPKGVEAQKLWQDYSLIFFLLLGQGLFVLIFGKGHFTHDYYGLQIALVFAMMGAEVLSRNRFFSHRPRELAVCLVAIFALSLYSNYRSLFPQRYLDDIAVTLQKNIPKGERVLVVGDGPLEAPLYLAHQEGYTLPYQEKFQESQLKPILRQFIHEKRAGYVLFVFFGEGIALGLQEELLSFFRIESARREVKMVEVQTVPNHAKDQKVNYALYRL